MFEYIVVVLRGSYYCYGFPWHVEKANHINELGEEGWELVSVYMDNTDTMAYFKRAIDDNVAIK